MLQFERQQNILTYLEARHSATIQELAQAVYASEASIRRDIAQLESKGYVERFYGGVLLAKYKNSVVPVNLRETAHSAVKDRIAAEAAARIRDGDTVILDASTTVFRICRHIRDRKHLKIVTNNLRICTELADCPQIQVFCTGGAYVSHSSCFLGPQAENFVRGINADLLFFSSQGISETGLITDVSEQEIAMRRVMLHQAKKRIFLCDSSKFGVCRPFTLCRKEDVDEILCDTALTFACPPPNFHTPL